MITGAVVVSAALATVARIVGRMHPALVFVAEFAPRHFVAMRHSIGIRPAGFALHLTMRHVFVAWAAVACHVTSLGQADALRRQDTQTAGPR